NTTTDASTRLRANTKVRLISWSSTVASPSGTADGRQVERFADAVLRQPGDIGSRDDQVGLQEQPVCRGILGQQPGRLPHQLHLLLGSSRIGLVDQIAEFLAVVPEVVVGVGEDADVA